VQRKRISLLILAMLMLSIVQFVSSTGTAGDTNASAPPVITPLWQGEPADAVAFSEDEKYVYVWKDSYGWVRGEYVLVLEYEETPYIYVYEVETGRLVTQATGAGFYKFDGKSLTKLWSHSALATSCRGYIFSDKVVVATTTGELYVFDYSGNVLKQINLGIDFVNSGFAVTDDEVYVAVGPGGQATFPAPVVLVDMINYNVTEVTIVDSRAMRLAIDSNRRFVVVSEQDGELRIVGFNGTVIWSMVRPEGLSSMAYNGKLLAVGGRDGWMAVYNVTDPRNPILIANHTDPDAGYSFGLYAPTSLSSSGIGGMDKLNRIVVFHNPYNGYTFLLHLPSRTWYKYVGGEVEVICVSYPAAVSPSGTYVYAGKTLFLVSYQDVQAMKPRVRFWGTMEFHREYQSLSDPLVLKAPARDWHLYFYSGKLTIKRVHVEPVPVGLIEDPDIQNGRLAKMLNKGLITAEIFYTENAEVKELDVKPGSDVADILREYGIENHDNYVATLSKIHFVPPPYFAEGYAWYGTVIHIPLDKPINIYDDIVMQLSTSIHTSTLLYNQTKRALGVLGIPVEIGGGLGVGATAYSKIANKMLIWYASRHGVSVSTAYAVATSQAVARVAGVVGVAVVVWGGVDAALVEWGGFGDINTQNWVIIAPTVVDEMGNKYSAIKLLLPLEESRNVETYYDRILKYFKDLGYIDVGFSTDYPCRTWDEYKALLAAGYSPRVRLDVLIEETIASKYGLDVDKLRIAGVDVFVITVAKAKETFWEWLFGVGGVDADTVTLIGTATIAVNGKLKAGTVTDPTQIASLLDKVTINGVDFELVSGADGAYADFAFTLGAESLVIDFGRRNGYFADVVMKTTVLVKKDFQPLGDFGYTATLHYDWEDVLIRIDRIEFIDMPYLMYKAERTFIYRYGNFTNDITEAFELNKTVDSDLSPTGKFYYYITRENTKFIDPANGGIMQPCKTYVFNYFYKPPPDVALNLYLNGTQVTSTKARHATVVLNSTEEQDVKYAITFKVKRLVGLEEEVLYEESLTDVLHCEANKTSHRVYLIERFVDLAIRTMALNGTPAFVEITARIIEAPHNYDKSNDEKTVVYYPPSALVEQYGRNATLTVYTYDAVTGEAVAGATVAVSNDVASYTATTNSTGYAVFNITEGLWSISAEKEGYHSYATELYVYGNMTFRIPLLPVNATPIVEPPMNATEPPVTYNETTYWWLSVQVIWKDGAPFEGALVTVKNVADNSTLFQGTTDGTGYVHCLIPNGTWIRVEVNATNPLNPTQTYFEARELNMTQHYWLVFRLPWISELHEPEVMLTSLKVVIHRGQGYYFGNVSHLILVGLWTNQPQTVTLRLELVNAETNETVNAKDVTVTLDEGRTLLMEWIGVNASEGMFVRAHANITSYEADTDLDNNELWSRAVFLKPQVDIQVFVLWRPVEQKQPWSLLPEDVIEVDIGVRIPVNTSTIPAKLSWRVDRLNLREMVFELERGAEEELRTTKPGVVWRNITVVVPWTSRITVLANVTHEWEAFGYNNYVNVTIWVDPDVKLEIAEKPAFAVEGQLLKVVVNLTSNVEPGKGIGWVSLVDNTTATLLKRVEVELEPERTVVLEARAPENPIAFWVVRVPSSTHDMSARFAGYDLYLENNSQEFKVTVVSYQWIVLILLVVVAIAVIAAVRAVAHTAFELREKSRRFVRRKRHLLEGATWGQEHGGEGEMRFVRRKRRED